MLFFIELSTRSVHIAGITTNPNDAFMLQVARNLTDFVESFLLDKHSLLGDRDTKYSKAFRGLLERDGIEIIRLPPNSPNLNAYAERFVRSIKEEALSRIIFLDDASLRRPIQDYMTHYLAERNHQGIDNRLITASNVIALTEGAVKRRNRLGGMLRFYYRGAA